LGMVVSLPEVDRLNWHKIECEQKLAMTMAGKAAEIIKYGADRVSNGPSGDIQQASALARAMVMRWGMSDLVGNIDYSEAHEGYSSGSAGGFSLSAKTKELIESEVKRLIDDAYTEAYRILEEKSEEFEHLAQGLLEYETLTGEEIGRVVKGEPPHTDDEDDADSADGGSASVTAIPKVGKPKDDGGMEPQPS